METTDRTDEENVPVKDTDKERLKSGKKKRRRTIDKAKVAKNKRKRKQGREQGRHRTEALETEESDGSLWRPVLLCSRLPELPEGILRGSIWICSRLRVRQWKLWYIWRQ